MSGKAVERGFFHTQFCVRSGEKNKNNNVEPRDELIFGKLARSVAISLVALIITYNHAGRAR